VHLFGIYLKQQVAGGLPPAGGPGHRIQAAAPAYSHLEWGAAKHLTALGTAPVVLSHPHLESATERFLPTYSFQGLMFHQALVVTDNTEIVTDTLKYVKDMFPGIRIHLLNVIHWEKGGEMEAIISIMSEELEGRVKELARKKLEDVGADGEAAEVVRGDPVPAIIKYQTDHDIDLLVTENYDFKGRPIPDLDQWVKRVIQTVNLPLLNIPSAKNLKAPRKVNMLVLDTNRDLGELTKDMAIDIATRLKGHISVSNITPGDGPGFDDLAKQGKAHSIKVKPLKEPESADKYEQFFVERTKKFNFVIMEATRDEGGSLPKIQLEVIAKSPCPVLMLWDEKLDVKPDLMAVLAAAETADTPPADIQTDAIINEINPLSGLPKEVTLEDDTDLLDLLAE